jgi:ribosome-associated protein
VIRIPESELEFHFFRSGGPGGQNVNKVSTSVQLRFDVVNSPSLSQPVKERLLKLAGSRATQAGEVLITAVRHRSQERNRADALERLQGLIDEASIRPAYRVPTRPTRASKERRLEGKARRSTVKGARRRPVGDD